MVWISPHLRPRAPGDQAVALRTTVRQAAERSLWLQVSCIRCLHQRGIAVRSLARTHGDRTLMAAARAMRCTECERRGEVRVWMLPPELW